MSAFDAEIADAKDDIAVFGQVCTWTSIARSQDNAQSWKGSEATTNHTVSILFTKSGGGIFAALYHLIRGTVIPTGAPKAVMASQSFTPNIGDKVSRAGEIMIIKAIDVLAPDGTPILYFLTFA